MNCYFCHLPTAPWPCHETVLLWFRETTGTAFSGEMRLIVVEETAHRKCVELTEKQLLPQGAA